MILPFAPTIPAVTVCPRPKGFDRDDPLPDLQLLRIAEMDVRELLAGLDLDERDVGPGVGPHHLRLELPLVQERHRDLVGFFHHVVVGEDETVLGDDETGAQAPALLLPGHVSEVIVPELLEGVLLPEG
jgi:hypothetical protein